MSVPRRASLAGDAVPSIFPDCPAHLSKVTKRRKRPAVRQPADVPKQKRVHRTDTAESAEEADDLKDSDRDRGGCSSNANSDPAALNVDAAEAPEIIPSAELSRQQVFSNLFELSAPTVLPTISWGYHRRDMDGVQNIAFTEMQWSTSPKLRGTTKSAISAAEKSHLVTTKLVDIDQKMQVSVVVMGRRVSTDELHIKDDIATIEDVKSFLQRLHEMPICGGGPK
ncbi:unnamed protein product, partial [Ixodes persulcatus]